MPVLTIPSEPEETAPPIMEIPSENESEPENPFPDNKPIPTFQFNWPPDNIACPQPGINVNLNDADLNEAEQSSWKYTRSFVMDGNFKAEHLPDRRPADQVWLMDRQGYMVEREDYKAYLKATNHPLERSTCNNHWAVNQVNTGHGKLEATRIGATACARHGCFVPHSIVDVQKGERQVNMDYSLAQALGYNMQGISNVVTFYDVNCSYIKKLRAQVANNAYIEIRPEVMIVPGIGIWHVHSHRPECYARYAPLFISGVGWVDSEELLDFQMNDSNFMKMIRMTNSLSWKLKAARNASASAVKTFNDLDHTQAKAAQERRISDPSAMDIYDLWLPKDTGRSIHAVELDLLQYMRQIGLHATEIQRLAVAWHTDRLSAEILGFLSEAKVHLGANYQDEVPSGDLESEYEGMNAHTGVADDDLMDKIEGQRLDRAYIPLPSSLGHSKCMQLGLQDLMDTESQLRIGQANDALQEIHLGVAEKAVLFRNNIHPVTSYAKKTRAWGRVHVAQHALEKQAVIYRKCQEALVSLGADEGTLARYQVLRKEQLNVNTSVTNPKVLPWYFNLDIETEQQSSAWMLEFIQVHCLRAKATKERWLEEEELLKSKFNWTISFFQCSMKKWKD
ncbi:hypothetical protein V8E55_011845 [Tylopilus felleus]